MSMEPANGKIQTRTTVSFPNVPMNQDFAPYALAICPAVISVGRRCVNDGYEFHWCPGTSPYFVRPDGQRVLLEVENYVPYIPEVALACPGSVPSVSPLCRPFPRRSPALLLTPIEITPLGSSEYWVTLSWLPITLPGNCPRIEKATTSDGVWTETPHFWICSHRTPRASLFVPADLPVPSLLHPNVTLS